MQPNNLVASVLLTLLFLSLLACADNPTEPELTEEDVARIVAQELAKMQDAQDDVLSPQEIAQIARRSTVVLRVRKSTGKWSRPSTGFVIGPGQIATAYHVVKDLVMGSTAKIIGHTTTHPIDTVLAIDQKRDLVILKAASLTAPALPLGDSDTVEVGDPVFIYGNPDGYIGVFSTGIISGLGAIFRESPCFQMTAPVSPGSSGSPVLNERAEVIGIARGIDIDGQNLNFSTPVNHLKALLKTIR